MNVYSRIYITKSGGIDGQERIFSGDDLDQAPYFNWNADNRKVNFNSYNTDNVNRNYAALSVRDCS